LRSATIKINPSASAIGKALTATALLLSLSGCFLLFGELLELGGLRLLATRAGIAEASAIGLRAGLGGEAFAATRIAQANMGAIIASDAALSRLATNSIRLQIGEGSLAESGIARIRSGGVDVDFGRSGRLRVTEPAPRTGQTGLFSDHYAGGQRVSYSRVSSDGIRIDYFIRDATNGQFKPALYALRDPSGKSIAFFGRNHAYLGKAVYRTVASRAAAGSVVAGAVAFIEMNDYMNTPFGEQCSDELMILRRTYFNRGELSETPDQFWESLYKDCKANVEVSDDYQRFELDKIYRVSSRQERYGALVQFVRRFPGNGEAKNMMEDMRK
jgi:hypothetical protein